MQVPLSRPPTPSWVHDFPVTQNYAVVPETPIFYDALVSVMDDAAACKLPMRVGRSPQIMFRRTFNER